MLHVFGTRAADCRVGGGGGGRGEPSAVGFQPSFSMTVEIKIINDCTQLKIHSRICDSVFLFEDRIGYTEMELIKI